MSKRSLLAHFLAPHAGRSSLVRAIRVRDVASTRAFTLLELVVIVVCIVVFAGFLFPAHFHARSGSGRGRMACVNNLKQIGLSFRIFATDNGDRTPMQVFTKRNGTLAFINAGQVFHYYLALSNELPAAKVLTCPYDARRAALSLRNLTDLNLSYFIGCDAEEALPRTLLGGDRNLEKNGKAVPPGLLLLTTNLTLGWTKAIHERSGNVVFGDGGVLLWTASDLSRLVAGQETATNRLMVP